MDVTTLFKACVKSVKIRNKATQEINIKNDILAKRPARSPKSRLFHTRCREVLVSITHLKNFILDHRDDYIDVRHLSCDIGAMTDLERDHIDKDTEKYMKLCHEVIKKLKAEFLLDKKSVEDGVNGHQHAVVKLLENYLIEICKLHSEQKAIRVKRSVELQKMSRLEPEACASKNKIDEGEKNEKPYRRTRQFSDENMQAEELSPEEMQMFEQENDDLYNELNNMVDEVRQVEGKVVEISRLQQIFSEKILQQDEDMERIAETAVSTTENIKEANEQIREAMKRNTGFRVWILFFLLVLSFSLLFLDWYNP